MALIVPRITDFNDPRQKFLMQQFLKDILDMAFRISFKALDGTIDGGKKPYNLDAVWVRYVSNGTANTEDTVSHNLGRTPVGLLIGVPDKNATIYADNTTAWSSTSIRLKASAATVTVNILVF
jgi:hypothetical protein